MDPVSTAALGAASKALSDSSAEGTKVAANLITRLFGPSADVIGENWADRLREGNLRRLLAKTEAREAAASARGEDPGFASTRVASQVFESAQFTDAAVVSEYLSGVLSSSRSPSGHDDAGVAWTSVVSRLSSDQLRLHYAIYASLRPLVLADPPERVSSLHSRDVVLDLRELRQLSAEDDYERFADAVDGLVRENLIDGHYSYGPREKVFEQELQHNNVAFLSAFVIKTALTVHGIRLFLWGNGSGRLGVDAYADPNVDLSAVDPDEMPSLVDAAFSDRILSIRSPEQSFG
ncbi:MULTISPECIES: hypothetical protein [unclassified Microbacterium]|uniref:hypothetical protein n=1 Tax=unclassified Microbacterium TaxID=2609290 RepID=UPI00109C15C6|nr:MULTISPECIES: hypothetical protein [unclassified Microbacterium]